MGGNQFDHIAEEIIKQKQRMDKLQAENDELHQQIADLRSGRGIFVDIQGIRFALKDDSSLAQANSASSVSSTNSASHTSKPSTTQPLHQQVVDAPTTEMTEITSHLRKHTTYAQTTQANSNVDKKAMGGESTFLEEILIDEFNNALASPNAVWQDPAEKKQTQQQKSQQQTAEEQKAALRRELMGSFLLE